MSKRPDREFQDRSENGPEPGPDDQHDSGPVLMLSRSAARELDRLSAEEYFIPSIVLMENAARHVAEVALDLIRPGESASVVVFCGPGNNGGDGLAAARHLHNAGAEVTVVLAAPRERYAGDAGTNLRIIERMGLPIVGAGSWKAGPEQAPAMAVDALLGTGLSKPVGGSLLDLINAINQLARKGTQVVAIDLPSGLDADSGAVLGAAVRADATVTMAGPKPGLCTLEAQPYVGELVIADIGVPRELLDRLGTPMPEVPPDRV